MQPIELYKELFQNVEVRIYGTREQPLFVANDIGKMLGMKNIHTTIKPFTDDEKTTIMIKTTQRKNMSVLTMDGLRRLLVITRKSVPCILLDFLKIREHRFVPAETDFIQNMQSATPDLKSIVQYKVLDYHIDLYFPDFYIAVEFDESHHKSTTESDSNREQNIIMELGCRFLRVKHTDNIFTAIGALRTLINKNHEFSKQIAIRCMEIEKLKIEVKKLQQAINLAHAELPLKQVELEIARLNFEKNSLLKQTIGSKFTIAQ